MLVEDQGPQKNWKSLVVTMGNIQAPEGLAVGAAVIWPVYPSYQPSAPTVTSTDSVSQILVGVTASEAAPRAVSAPTHNAASTARCSRTQRKDGWAREAAEGAGEFMGAVRV